MPEYLHGRKKGKVKKICMNCGIEYDDYPSGVVNPGKKERGLCPDCRYGQGYSEDDLNKQDVGE